MRIVVPLIVVVWLIACSRGEAAQAAGPGSFDPIASVVMHPRCMNCHQVDSPRQTDAAIRHQPLVVRGSDGHGAPTQTCQTCHQATNTADGFVPGVATWRLAPLSMNWQGLTAEQICEQVKDPVRNGGRRAGKDVIEHMKEDPLVLWAWTPGANRTTPPITHEKFVEALEAWVKAGMPCRKPSESTGGVQYRPPTGPLCITPAKKGSGAGDVALEHDRYFAQNP